MTRASLIQAIKQKKELRGIADAIVASELSKVLKQINKPELSAREERLVLKEVRARLRNLTGRFVSAEEDSHRSVEERGLSYALLHTELQRLAPHKIIDLGAGLNPLRLATKKTEYYAYDINESNVTTVNAFFKKQAIKGKAFVHDVRIPYPYPAADLALLLKLVDLLDTKGHKEAEQLMRLLPVKVLIVSFSTKTLSGKPMNHPQRGWIEQLCVRLGWKYNKVTAPNELFYIIEKQ